MHLSPAGLPVDAAAAAEADAAADAVATVEAATAAEVWVLPPALRAYADAAAAALYYMHPLSCDRLSCTWNLIRWSSH